MHTRSWYYKIWNSRCSIVNNTYTFYDTMVTEEQKIKNKEYYEKNKERIREYHKEYNQRDYVKEKNRKRAIPYKELLEEGRSGRREATKKWKDNNKEKVKKQYADWYAKNGTTKNAYNKKKRLERRKMVLEHYGGKCECCNEDTYEFLALDHINGDGGKHRKEIGGGGNKIIDWIVKNNYPEGFRVLCHNCNMAYGLYGACPHKKGELL